MKNLSSLFFVVSVIFLMAACSDSSPTTSEEDKKKSEAEQEHNAVDKSRDQEKEDSNPIQPFKALKPSDGTKPLKEKLSKEEQEKMPAAESYGNDRTRSVPVGQTLVNGAEDPSDGPLKNNRIVAFYGHPNSANMGILGEMEPEALMKKLKEQTQSYSDADPSKPAIPAIELITTVAQRSPGPEGKYYRMTPEDDIEKYAKLARENNALLLLDVQLGKDSVMNQVKLIEKWLKYPYVHLAIDTEFHVGEGETPGMDLGQVDWAEVQKAVEYLSKLVEENNLPDKFVLVHQFTDKAITNKAAIKPTNNVEVVLNYDGWGPASTKQSLYRKFVRNETSQYGGFKIFLKKDEPVMKPLDVIKLDPSPAIINYQ
ncbi:hypothetical protein [Pseudalkalibacillus salsuginis]|uniref:hypothetical protein n=1 Tax=Pseudalkalibacillus salsuginis TaxID=2910972 RepID=UPI001F1818E9|nr:hypothetical protein [Pseudalkalibacillus salsuginis]MCF6410205.1 hypothetical protein [Pseudalkalibacillus salsuginis]